MEDHAVIECQDVHHVLRLQSIARGLGLRSSYLPFGGTDDAHDKPIVHALGLLGDPQVVHDFVRNYGA